MTDIHPGLLRPYFAKTAIHGGVLYGCVDGFDFPLMLIRNQSNNAANNTVVTALHGGILHGGVDAMIGFGLPKETM